ncbi:MAG: polyprenyl synthetase family protein [Bacteroidales bacterium]|jgi:geranylgeranyl diphosphate synthase type II|nr:polyprenyl synthetase family protein [Bacteroidales bacterium]
MRTFAEILTYVVEKEREIVKFNQPPTGLFEPIEYMLSLGGKKIRPALTLLACDLFSGKLDEAIYPALGIEVFHNFTLMHDDVMDKADVRRGKMTVHRLWDSNTAILSGDAMFSYASQLISSCSLEFLPDVLHLFSSTAMDVFRGQQFDMDFETQPSVSKQQYMEMIRLKTAVLLGCALKLGAIVARAARADAQHLYDFGVKLGLAFQLKDDLLDVYGNALTFGKAIGGDILCNKKTFLLINALQQSTPKQKKKLNHWLSISRYRNANEKQKKIACVTEIFNQTNCRETCSLLMDEYYMAALLDLDLLLVESERKQELRLLAENLMRREN